MARGDLTDGRPEDRTDDQDHRTDDRVLLAAHVDGDPDAFGTLFARHRDRLWAVALRTTGDPEEAADALQDAMVSAFRRADSYRADAAVTTWLHRIVVNACLDRLRRRQVRAAEPLPEEPDAFPDPTGTSTGPAGRAGDRAGDRAGTDPAELVLDTERRDRVLEALGTLPPEQRAALVLVDMEGYPVEEVARILDCAPGTVKSRCSRGRLRLAPLLADLLGDTGESAAVEGTREPPDAPDRPSTRPGRGGDPS